MAPRLITSTLGAGSGGGPAAKAGRGMALRTNARASVFFIVLESCCGREVDELWAVIGRFDVGKRQIDLDRAEGRTPLHADAGGGAEGQIVLDAGALGCGGIGRADADGV